MDWAVEGAEKTVVVADHVTADLIVNMYDKMMKREAFRNSPAGILRRRWQEYYNFKWAHGGRDKLWGITFLQVCQEFNLLAFLNYEEGYTTHGNGD